MKHYLTPLLLIAGCAAPLAPPSPAAPDTDGWYLQAVAAGTPVYRIEPNGSLITVTVRRGGLIARMGHDHAVASRNITGYAAPTEGRADFGFRLDQLTVDEPALRTLAGLPATVPAEAVAGTRANMLGRVLEAGRYPVVRLRAQPLAGASGTLRLAITLHGVTRSIDVPTALEVTPETLAATGSFRLRQTEFGITPMSLLGGALVVRDEMELSFRIHASRVR